MTAAAQHHSKNELVFVKQKSQEDNNDKMMQVTIQQAHQVLQKCVVPKQKYTAVEQQ